MPRRLLVMSSIFCLLGAVALTESVVHLLCGDGLVLSSSLLMLPIGAGLLRRNRRARLFATYYFSLTATLGVVGAVMTLLDATVPAEFSLFGAALTGGPATVAMAVVLLALAVASVLLIRMLYTPPVSPVFGDLPLSGGSHGSSGSGQPA